MIRHVRTEFGAHPYTHYLATTEILDAISARLIQIAGKVSVDEQSD